MGLLTPPHPGSHVTTSHRTNVFKTQQKIDSSLKGKEDERESKKSLATQGKKKKSHRALILLVFFVVLFSFVFLSTLTHFKLSVVNKNMALNTALLQLTMKIVVLASNIYMSWE